MQRRVLHMLRHLNVEPGHVPASNVVFMRSPRGADIKSRFAELAGLCWPFHQRVIEQLRVRVVLCLGNDAGDWVRNRLNAHNHVGEFVESNDRRWKSIAFMASTGITVVVATHPSIADWTKPSTDPTPFVHRMLAV
jgi:uracil-DNA glycosylase